MNLLDPEFLNKKKRIKRNQCLYRNCEGSISELSLNKGMALCDAHFALLNVNEVEVENDRGGIMCNDANKTSTSLIGPDRPSNSETQKQACNLMCKPVGNKDNDTEIPKSSVISTSLAQSDVNTTSSENSNRNSISSREEELSNLLSTIVQQYDLFRRLQQEDGEKYKDVKLENMMKKATKVLGECSLFGIPNAHTLKCHIMTQWFLCNLTFSRRFY